MARPHGKMEEGLLAQGSPKSKRMNGNSDRPTRVLILNVLHHIINLIVADPHENKLVITT
jgi:hypothetical protein